MEEGARQEEAVLRRLGKSRGIGEQTGKDVARDPGGEGGDAGAPRDRRAERAVPVTLSGFPVLRIMRADEPRVTLMGMRLAHLVHLHAHARRTCRGGDRLREGEGHRHQGENTGEESLASSHVA